MDKRLAIRFEKSKPEDARALALASRDAFNNDVNYGAPGPGPGGSPGYDSDLWQLRFMTVGMGTFTRKAASLKRGNWRAAHCV